MQAFSFFLFFWPFVVGGDFGSGSGSKFNCAARVGSGRVVSDDLGYGPGSGFSFEPVQTSSAYYCRIIFCPNFFLSVLLVAHCMRIFGA